MGLYILYNIYKNTYLPQHHKKLKKKNTLKTFLFSVVYLIFFMYVYFRGSRNSYMAALVSGCSFITIYLHFIIHRLTMSYSFWVSCLCLSSVCILFECVSILDSSV